MQDNLLFLCETIVAIHTLILFQSVVCDKITSRIEHILLALVSTADQVYGRSDIISPMYTPKGKKPTAVHNHVDYIFQSYLLAI